MKNFISVLLVYLGFLNSSYAQIDKEKIYDKSWRIEENTVLKPAEIVTLYSRYTEQNLYDFSSVITTYKRDGTKSGFNARGKPSSNIWKFISDDMITSGNDLRPAKIIKLTSTEFIVEVHQDYVEPLTGSITPIIWRTKYVSFDPCALYESLRSGDWNDPTIWSCQKVPNVNTIVQINLNHKVTIPANYIAYAKQVKHTGNVKFNANAKLELGK